ncbi:SLATT domain-containing protein [Actinoplanes sp. NPDC026623]|uniref:SLATT domain-containing protein n=1 Tax=Actinoplanes sp. NPDC026623 TaxID=3155610 RepID=UPI0033C3C7B3
MGSLATSTLTALAVEQGRYRWIPIFTSFAVGAAAGFTGYFKFRERGFYLQQTADAIEHEYSAVELSIGPYRTQSSGDALAVFVAEVERLRLEQRKREQSLDQPSEGTPGDRGEA